MESAALSAICDYLAAKRHFFWRSNNIPAFNRRADGSVQMRRLPQHSMRGLPDIIVIKDGFFVGLEVKAQKGRQSPHQKEFEARCKDAGGEYHVVRSIDDVREVGL